MAELKTDYKDSILAESMGGHRQFQMVKNDNGTYSFVDVSEYQQVGDEFGADDINGIVSNLVNEDGEVFIYGILDGKRGLYTDPNRGADSFVPFRSGGAEFYFSPNISEDWVFADNFLVQTAGTGGSLTSTSKEGITGTGGSGSNWGVLMLTSQHLIDFSKYKYMQVIGTITAPTAISHVCIARTQGSVSCAQWQGAFTAPTFNLDKIMDFSFNKIIDISDVNDSAYLLFATSGQQYGKGTLDIKAILFYADNPYGELMKL